MNWLNLAAMKGQQAPTARPTVCGMQSSRLAPCQTASIRRKLTLGHISAATRAALATVRIEFATLPNSRCRSHPGRPLLACGGSIGATSSWRTKASCASIAASPLGQPDAGIVQVHGQAGEERDQEVDGHGDGDDLDRLAGLVVSRCGKDCKQIGTA